MTGVEIFILIYLAAISVVSIAVTCIDKAIAGSGQRRVPEATLLLLSAIGGSVAMFITMLLIRHKTKHSKFMVGIPVIMIIQAALVACYFLFLR